MSDKDEDMINLEFRQIADLNSVIEQIAVHKDIKRISLHGNRLKALPKDLSLIGHIEYMDISGNLFKGPLEDIIASLKTMPKLKELIITLNSIQEEKQIISNLPRLEFLNGTRILKDKMKVSTSNSLLIKENFDQSVNRRVFRDKLSTIDLPNVDSRADQQAHNSLNYIMSNNQNPITFQDSLDNSEIQIILTLYDELSTLKASSAESYDLREELHNHLSNILMDLDVNSKQLKQRLSKEIHMLKARFALIDIIFHKFLEILSEDKNNHFKVTSQRILTGFYGVLVQVFKGFIDLAILMEPRSESNFDTLKEKIKKTVQEPSSAIDKSEKLIRHNEEVLKAWQNEVKGFHTQIIELKEEIKALENENKALLDKLIKHTKERLEHANVAVPKEKSKSPAHLHNNDSVNWNGANKTYCPPALANNFQNLQKNKKLPKKLDSLKETISELCQAKVLADKKNEENLNSKETMEQFIYSYFKNKYGLKNLVADQAEQLILGIQEFKDYDVGVFIFGKILRNEIDEGYLQIHQGLKKTINDCLKILIQKKSPYLPQTAVLSSVEKLSQGGKLPNEDLQKIASFILGNNKKDVELFVKLLGADNEILVKEFEQKLCHYRLMKYENGLKPFNLLFKKIDEDGIGVLNTDRLEDMFGVLNKITESQGYTLDLQNALAKLDPGKLDKITYNQIVSYLLTIALEFNGRTVSYIQFLKIITK